jgi:dephospho-CoA kinase
MKFIGLTGGIASGKSTVRKMLQEAGAEVLDVDAIYHALIAPKGCRPSALAKAIASEFGGVLAADGTLDRQELSQLVFADAQARLRLEAITHPAVAKEVRRRASALSSKGVARIIYDVPLLYEGGMDRDCAGVIVVWVPREVQLRRLIARDQIGPGQAEARLAAQMSLDKKRKRATWVIDNSGSLAATEAQVDELWRSISAGSGF